MPLFIIIPFAYGISPKCDGITDDTFAIQSEINNHNASLSLGVCNISSPLYIGNGTNSTESRLNDLSLEGKGMGSASDLSDLWKTGGTILNYTGPINNGALIYVKGPTFDDVIKNIHLNLNGKLATGIRITQWYDSELDHVRVSNFTVDAFIFSLNNTKILGVGNGNCHNDYHHLATNWPENSSGSGIVLDGDLNGLDSCSDSFYDTEILYNGNPGTCGINLKYTDHNYFYSTFNFAVNQNNGGHSVCFSNSTSPFPSKNVFYSMASNQPITKSNTYGNWFIPYIDGEGSPNSLPYGTNAIYENGTINTVIPFNFIMPDGYQFPAKLYQQDYITLQGMMLNNTSTIEKNTNNQPISSPIAVINFAKYLYPSHH